jgi:hypothetical protein
MLSTTPRITRFLRRARLSFVGGALAALLVTAASQAGHAADLFDKLPAATRAALERGEQVVRTQDVSGSNWPAVTIYQLVDVTPEVAAAVFTDYGDQINYLRECCGLRQAVVRDPAVAGNPRVVRVFYELQVPVFSNERYELLETITKSEDGSYSITWKKVGTSGHAEDIVGRVYFEPRGSGTLISYYNLVKMNVFGSSLFAGSSVDRTKSTVNAFARRMEQVAAHGGEKLEKQLERLRAAVGG